MHTCFYLGVVVAKMQTLARVPSPEYGNFKPLTSKAGEGFLLYDFVIVFRRAGYHELGAGIRTRVSRMIVIDGV